MFLSLASIATLVGCSPASTASTCEFGTTDPENSVRGFLNAVQENDQETAQRFLISGYEAATEAWSELGASLDETSLDELKLISDRLSPEAVSFKVVLADGSVLGVFSTYTLEGAPGCAAVAWGTYSEASEAAPTPTSST